VVAPALAASHTQTSKQLPGPCSSLATGTAASTLTGLSRAGRLLDFPLYYTALGLQQCLRNRPRTSLIESHAAVFQD